MCIIKFPHFILPLSKSSLIVLIDTKLDVPMVPIIIYETIFFLHYYYYCLFSITQINNMASNQFFSLITFIINVKRKIHFYKDYNLSVILFNLKRTVNSTFLGLR